MTPAKLTTLAAIVGKPLAAMTVTELLRGMANVCTLGPESPSVDRAGVFVSIMQEAQRRDEQREGVTA